MGDRIPADKIHLKEPVIVPIPGRPAPGNSSTTSTLLTVAVIAAVAWFIFK